MNAEVTEGPKVGAVNVKFPVSPVVMVAVSPTVNDAGLTVNVPEEMLGPATTLTTAVLLVSVCVPAALFRFSVYVVDDPAAPDGLDNCVVVGLVVMVIDPPPPVIRP